MSTCAACGKGGDGLKACTGCGQVKYCNNACRKAHYKTHKKQCRQQRAGKKLATNDVAISCSNIDALSDEMNRIVISEMSCSKILHPKRIVQSVFFRCHTHLELVMCNRYINHAVGKSCVLDVRIWPLTKCAKEL